MIYWWMTVELSTQVVLAQIYAVLLMQLDLTKLEERIALTGRDGPNISYGPGLNEKK
jgi:hypothetical protein